MRTQSDCHQIAVQAVGISCERMRARYDCHQTTAVQAVGISCERMRARCDCHQIAVQAVGISCECMRTQSDCHQTTAVESCRNLMQVQKSHGASCARLVQVVRQSHCRCTELDVSGGKVARELNGSRTAVAQVRLREGKKKEIRTGIAQLYDFLVAMQFIKKSFK